jgi:hypothetical protein
MIIPTQTSLILQVLKSMASHIISAERRNLYVMGILAIERPVPLVQVSSSFLVAEVALRVLTQVP